MRNCLKLCALTMSFALMSGCAAKTDSQDDNSAFHSSYQKAYDKVPAPETRTVLQKAKTALGTPYVRGGTDTSGFDCSGFVCWAYKSVGVDLPRSAKEQSLVGTPITRIEDMREGDIVAFRHPRRGYHTGIYVGDGKFIHSPRRRSSVHITSLSDPYFSNTLLGARRISFSGNETLVAEARSRLNDYAEEKAVRDLTDKDEAKIKKTGPKKLGKTNFVAEKNKKPDTEKITKSAVENKNIASSKNAKSTKPALVKKNKNHTVADGTAAEKSKLKNPRDKANKS